MIESLTQLRAFLVGKKTYLLMAAAALTALGSYADGALTLNELFTALLNAGGLSTLRAGVNTAVNQGVNKS